MKTQEDELRQELDSVDGYSAIKQVATHLGEYTKLKLEYHSLDSAEKVGSGISSAVFIVVTLILALLAYFFVMLFAGFALSYYTDSAMTGFGIIAGFHVFLLLLYALIHKLFIKKTITDTIMVKALKAIKKDG